MARLLKNRTAKEASRASGGFDRLDPPTGPPPSRNSPGSRYFKLLEDATSTGVQMVIAEASNKYGDSLGGYYEVYSWSGILEGAQAGFFGQFSKIDGTWDFTQGKCPTKCPHTGVVTPGSAPNGVVGTAYSHTVTNSGVTSLTASDLPPGVTMNGSGVLSGTPTEIGDFYVSITANATKTAAAVAVQ